MAEIKTRDVTRGTIKTLDRAASSMHHMKEQTIRSKSLELGSGRDNESANSYARDTTEHYAGNSVRHVAEDGIDLAIRNRQKAQKPTDYPSDNKGQVQSAFREHGIKTIRGRQARAKMADEEVLRNAEEASLTGRIRIASAKNQARSSRHGIVRTTKDQPKPLKTEVLAQKRRREYAIRRITERNAGKGVLGGITSFGSKGSGKAAKGVGRLIKGAADGAKALLSSLSLSGAAAVVILVIMVLFGAALTFNEDGSYMEGSGDGTIVEVAKAELGNVGGDKFWKWYGFNNHVDWCAIFVSWCADQCGYIETGIVPKFAVVGDGASWFKTRHRWSGRGYKPNPGDIIFFDYEQDGVLDHVGIVESCDGRIVTTIEGNSGNACRRNSYGVGNAQIAGYGLLLIPGGENNTQ